MSVANWVNLIIGLVTLAGLVFVYLELRARNRDERVDAHRYVVESDRQLWSVALESPDVAPKLMEERWGGYPGLSASEALFSAQIIDHMEHIYFRRQKGLISDEVWPAIDRTIRTNLATESVDTVWSAHYDFYWSEFNDRYGPPGDVERP